MNRLGGYSEDVLEHFDAWDIDASYRKWSWRVRGISGLIRYRKGWEAVLRITRKNWQPSIHRTLRFEAGQKRLEFHTRIDWWELHRLLKAAFPVRVHGKRQAM